MTSPAADRLRGLFAELAELDEPARSERLERLRKGGEPLLDDLAALLRHHDEPVACLREPDSVDTRTSLLVTALLPAPRLPDYIGPYAIEGEIARGGMGIVYRGRQGSPARTVAVKVLRPGLIDAVTQRRFDQEVQVLGLFSHPGIARIFDAGTCEIGFGPQPYFAMEFVDGETLRTGAHHLTVAERCELVARVCDAVQHAHEHGVVHRDLKPENILLTRPDGADRVGQPKVLDFGIARSEEHADGHTTMTSHGMLLGTLPYMSPERLSSGAATPAADVYSLGALLFELLTGELPLELADKTLTEAVRTLQDQSPRRLRRIDRSLPPDLELVVQKALAKEPPLRYPSAQALAADLRRVVANLPVEARPLTTWYQLRKFASRNRALTISLVSLLTALVVGIASTTLYAGRAERSAVAATEAAERAARKSYAATTLAVSVHQATDTYEAARLLESTEPRFRGFEWHLLQAMSDPADRLIEFGDHRHAGKWTYRPDGTGLIAYCDDSVLRVQEVDSLVVVAEWQLPAPPIHYVYLSADGSRVGTAIAPRDGWARRLVVYDVATGATLFDRESPDVQLRTMKFSPDGRYLLTDGHYPGRALLRVDLEAGTWQVFPTKAAYNPLNITPDSRAFVDGGVVRDIDTFEELRRITPYDQMSVLSPDGRFVAGTIDGHRWVYLGRIGDESTMYDPLVAFKALVQGIEWSPDGKLLLAASWTAGAIKVVDVATKKLLHQLELPTAHQPSLHPQGESVLTWTPRGIERIPLGKTRRELGPHDDYLTAVAWSPDGVLLASTDLDGLVTVWNADDGARLFEHQIAIETEETEVVGLAWDRDGLGIRIVDERDHVHHLDLTTARDTVLVEERIRARADDAPWPVWQRVCTGARLHRTLTTSPDGTLATVRRRDGHALVEFATRRVLLTEAQWTAAAEAVPPRTGLAGEIQHRMSRYGPYNRGLATAISADNRLFATGHALGFVLVFDLTSDAPPRVIEAHVGDVFSLEFTPDGRLLSGGLDGKLFVWDPATGDRLAAFYEHSRGIECIAMSPDGSRFATASADRTVRVWDTVPDWQRARDATAQVARIDRLAAQLAAAGTSPTELGLRELCARSADDALQRLAARVLWLRHLQR